MRRLVTSELLSDVRSLVDETNSADVKDIEDILPALNRAQDIAANILSRQYESPLLVPLAVALTAGIQEYDIPENAFEQRLEKVEININGYFSEVPRISYRDITDFESRATVTYPFAYCVIGNKYRLLPNVNAAHPLRIWYLRDPEPLVLEQGRITRINSALNYIIVDALGEDITTDASELNSFVNLIDGSTGLVKGSLQVQSIAGNRITFKSTPSRDTVLGKTILGSLPSDLDQDDYLCTISGTCIPFFKKPVSNYIIQLAVADIVRKLGANTDVELRLKEELEDLVQRSWAGREQTLRVKQTNRNWARPKRRFVTPTGTV